MNTVNILKLLIIAVAFITVAFGVLIWAGAGPGLQPQKFVGAALVLLSITCFIFTGRIQFKGNRFGNDL